MASNRAAKVLFPRQFREVGNASFQKITDNSKHKIHKLSACTRNPFQALHKSVEKFQTIGFHLWPGSVFALLEKGPLLPYYWSSGQKRTTPILIFCPKSWCLLLQASLDSQIEDVLISYHINLEQITCKWTCFRSKDGLEKSMVVKL